MATDDDRQAAEATEFQKKLDVMVVATAATKKRYDAAHTRVLAATVLLEEEQRTATVLIEEARAVAALIEPPSPMPPSTPTGCTALSDDDWLALENHFLGNHETRALNIDATFRSFVQGDLSINDYCRKMKGFTNSLTDLSVDITDCVLMLNVLCGLNKNFEHLRAIFTHATPFLSFQKVLNDLCL
jgi:hypothetical protein